MGAIWATNSNQPSINNRLELIQVAHYKFEIEHFVEIEIANLRRARACLKSSIIIIHVLQIGPTIECERMKKKNAFATNSCTKPRPVATNNEKKKVQHDKKHIANSVDTKSPAVVSRHRKKKLNKIFNLIQNQLNSLCRLLLQFQFTIEKLFKFLILSYSQKTHSWHIECNTI